MTDIPTTPPPIADRPPAPPQKWPVVIGTISIVIAVTGLTCVPTGMLIRTFVLRHQSFDADLSYMNFFLGAVKIIISVLLLVAGINLVRRRRSACILHLVWAVVRIPAVLIGVIVAYSMLYPANQTSSPSDKFAFLVIIPMIMSGILALAWPVFVLIWFNRTKIKQQVAEW